MDDFRKSPSPSIASNRSKSRPNIDRATSLSVATMYPDFTDMYYEDHFTGADPNDYDFTANRPQVFYGTNLIESIAHLIKGCLGAGILGMHEAFMHGGLWTSLGAGVIIGIVVSYTMMMLVHAAQSLYVRLRIPQLSYPDLAEASLTAGPIKCLRKHGKIFRYIVDTFLIVHLFGACCVYQVILAETLREGLENASPAMAEMNLPIRVYIAMLILPLMLLCVIRTLKYLAIFAILADAILLLAVILTGYYTFEIGADIHERPAYKNLTGLYYYCGMFIFTVNGIGIALPIENHMKRPKLFYLVLLIGMTAVVVISLTVGFLGYWAWGEKCQTPITVHLPVSTYTTILQFLFAMMLCVTFSISFWVPFKGIWYYIARRHRRKHGIWERFYRVLHVLLITLVSILVPNIRKMMIFLGGFCLICLGFLFPAFIDTLIFWRTDRNMCIPWRLIKNILLSFCGYAIIFGALHIF